jgi:hypothetical protein
MKTGECAVLWVMFGNDENTPTEAQYQGRLDYAIASPSLAKKVKNITDWRDMAIF